MFPRGKEGINSPIDMLCLLLKTCSTQSTHPKIEKVELFAWQNKRDEASLPAFASAAFHMSSPVKIVNILSSTEFRKVLSCKGPLHATSEHTHVLYATGGEMVNLALCASFFSAVGGLAVGSALLAIRLRQKETKFHPSYFKMKNTFRNKSARHALFLD